MKKLLFTACLLLAQLVLFAGNGVITGRVVDEKGETLIGASVLIEGTTNGVKTNLDGQFTLRNLEDGQYNLVVSYVSYEKKILTGIVVSGGKSEPQNVTLLKSGKGLKEVVVKTQVRKESINALQIQQKNLTTISDGISAEVIRKTPDRNTGDVLKRVSGVSITDNKFAVIRGLADRYNLAMLNGDILPSSESDRKAFSFDIFPAALLDNIVIVKAATPDRPAEFAGGIIDLTTKEMPVESFVNIQLGTGMNTISTFNSYYDSKNSKTDWLGYDKTMRVIPAGFPDRNQLNLTNTVAQNVEASKTMQNTWGAEQKSSMAPFRNGQLSAGWLKKLNKEASVGVIGALTYNRNTRNYFIERNEIVGADEAYAYKDTATRDNVLIGSMLNVGFKINQRNKISLRNSFTLNAEDQTVRRQGNSFDNEYLLKGSALWFTNNQLLSNQLNGEHTLTKHDIKVQYGVGRNHIVRTIPDLRRSIYTMSYDTQDSLYRTIITNTPNTFYMGRFFAKTKETIYSGNLDVSLPYTLLKQKHMLKVGAYYQDKSRIYDARVLAYVKAKNSGFQTGLLTLPEEQIFAQENIRENGFIIKDATQPQDYYEAGSKLTAAYVMSENMVADQFRFVYGVRVENFEQQLITGNITQGDLDVRKNNTNVLPSLNFTYMLNKKTNIRASAYSTLSRPEFREISPASFFDYNLSATFTGNTQLEQTRIRNVDLRYEYFMGKGEMVSASVFYKHFDSPIELAVDKGSAPSNKVFSYINAKDAVSVGFETEFRKSLSFLTQNQKSALNHITLFGNFSYIHSSVGIEDTNVSGEKTSYTRPMQGQSPYIINGGITYQHPTAELSFTAVYNRIGERIFAVGNSAFVPDLYEAPRHIVDLSISKKFFKKLEVKLTCSDLLSNPQVFYYNIDKDHVRVTGENGYNKNKDYTVIKTRLGTNFGFSLAYQL